MTQRIDELKVHLANSKRKITNFSKFVDDYNTDRDCHILEKRKLDIDEEFATFEKHFTELELLVPGTDCSSVRTEYEEKYYSAYAKAIGFSQGSPLSNQQVECTASLNSNSRGSPSIANSKTILPRINLPSFNGSYESWIGFHDLFKKLVDEDENISNIEKLYHLKGCLQGEASELVASVELSADNYRVAWDLLKERYDNRKIIRETHVNSLLNLPVASKEFTLRSLLDQVQKHVRALEALKEPIDQWDTLLIGIIKQKLSSFYNEKWSEFSADIEKPTFQNLITFLQRRAQFEENNLHLNNGKSQTLLDKKSKFRPNQRSQQACSATTIKSPCPHCKDSHAIYHCEKFKKLTPHQRFEITKNLMLCINCLRNNHRVADCTGQPCRKCRHKHNILLHFDKKPTEPSESEKPLNSQSIVNSHYAQIASEGLLATAIVDLVNPQGDIKTCRAFLDSGSQANFITANVASFLKLKRKSVDVCVSGVDSISTELKYSVLATIKSRFNNFSKNLEFLVLNQITNQMPSIEIDRSTLEIPKNITLADPEFHKPSDIDILIGVKLFYKLLCVGHIALKNHPDTILQKTQLGWIVTGEIDRVHSKNNVQCHAIIHLNPLEEKLTKFWEIEEIPTKKFLSVEAKRCEEHFSENTYRNTEGNYTVRLPFNEKKNKLTDSRSIALRRLFYLEKKFERDLNLKIEYCNFIREYEELNHLSLIKDKNLSDRGFYLPHHAVVKEDSSTTKLRVVFDGSAKTSSGVSLNDSLMVGPTLQSDLCTLVTRFRSHKIALTADIEKMYRQILVHPDDAEYQKILFRTDVKKTVQELKLNTVTYGTSCAPFLAIRTLHQLADDERAQHPIGSSILKEDFYVDDVLTGADTIEEAIIIRDDLIALLKKGGFNLRKWSSNCPLLVPFDSENSINKDMSFDSNSTVKTLGIHWNPREDFIFYKVNLKDSSKIISKRSILSQVAKLFDPLGLLGPIVVRAKIIIQLLWKAGVSWDSSIPQDIHTMWIEFKEQLPLVEQIRFQRCIISSDAIQFELHGFCDASEKAYGACLYLRSTNSNQIHSVSLICSKSRVAPVKSISLPRLELCAALLLTRLVDWIKKALRLEFKKVYLWSDSMITLQWIKTEPYLLKTFVANRVSEIQEGSKNCEWRHTPTDSNAADPLSRGLSTQEFSESTIWKNGPSWLIEEENHWPHENISVVEVPERKKVLSHSIQKKESIIDDNFIQRFSSIKSLTSVLAYVLRFIYNLKNKANRIQGPITPDEINNANLTLIENIQSNSFCKEIRSLKVGEGIPEKSKLIPLNPFVDERGILRVGGRLINANLPEHKKHQILLPADHHLTRLIIREEHERLKHAGTQATLYSVRELFWPLNGKDTTRKIIHNCIRCFRAKPRDVDYIMGNLPQNRVNFTRPFSNVGVDYCGPLYIKEKRHRNRNKIKVYVSVFVCMSTKAVHLELVSDLTSEAFIGCLKRLFSRRGISETISSDNATNFVGASRELVELYKLLQSTEHNDIIKNFLSEQKVIWNFIPPRSPHFGGLWEAAVKSFKHHLIRTVGDTLLTFEQLETYIVEIEAILNSRPICPMSSDPNDFQALTPGHFLIGGPLTSFPQLNLLDINTNRLSAWENSQKLRQHFWKRWHKEYLHQLTVRSKWQTNSGHLIELGSMVVMKEDNLPPLQWKLGRIIATHAGQDGIVRVVTVKTDTGNYKRCIKKICPLPIETSTEAN